MLTIRGFVILSAFLLSVCVAPMAFALETDQFTLPAKPLRDVSPELNGAIFQVLQQITARANYDIAQHESLAAKSTGKQRDRALAAMKQLLGETFIAKEFADIVAPGLPESRIEQWIRRENFGDNAHFQLSAADSIYGATAITRPLLFVDFAPTVNLNGVYLGTDKIGHFFQQGHEYYQMFHKERAAGRDDKTAIARAVAHGVNWEKTIYGGWTTDTYSNADLAADYAGLKFYLNLTRPVRVGNSLRPPILVQRNYRWCINPKAGFDFLNPFITDHLDEAMNPCRYGWGMRGGIRNGIHKRSPQWLAFHKLTTEQYEQHTKSLTTWFGEDYGYRGDDVIAVKN